MTFEHKTKDGVACFTPRGIEIAKKDLDRKKKWVTVEDVISDFNTRQWLRYKPTSGEVTECIRRIEVKTKDGVLCFTQRGIERWRSHFASSWFWRHRFGNRGKTAEEAIAEYKTSSVLAGHSGVTSFNLKGYVIPCDR